MADNSIALAQSYLKAIDATYKRASVTSILDSPQDMWEGGAKGDTIYFRENTMVGLADHNREGDLVKRAVTSVWQSYKLPYDRSGVILVDELDEKEGMETVFAPASREFLEGHVIPEVDALRFKAYYAGASADSQVVNSTLSTRANLVTAIDTGRAALGNNEVPDVGLVMYVSYAMWNLIKPDVVYDGTKIYDRQVAYFDGMQVIPVPSGRFYSSVDTLDGVKEGEQAGGFEASDGAKSIQFMIVHPSSVLQVVTHDKPRIFSADVYQAQRANAFDYRIRHGAFKFNKKKGIYCSTTT